MVHSIYGTQQLSKYVPELADCLTAELTEAQLAQLQSDTDEVRRGRARNTAHTDMIVA